MTLRVSFVAGGDASPPPADYPAGARTGMGIVACTVGAGLLCLCVAGAIRLGAIDVTFRRRAVRGWLIAAGVCVLVCAVIAHRRQLTGFGGSTTICLLFYSSVLRKGRSFPKF